MHAHPLCAGARADSGDRIPPAADAPPPLHAQTMGHARRGGACGRRRRGAGGGGAGAGGGASTRVRAGKRACRAPPEDVLLSSVGLSSVLPRCFRVAAAFPSHLPADLLCFAPRASRVLGPGRASAEAMGRRTRMAPPIGTRLTRGARAPSMRARRRGVCARVCARARVQGVVCRVSRARAVGGDVRGVPVYGMRTPRARACGRRWAVPVWGVARRVSGDADPYTPTHGVYRGTCRGDV